MGTHPIFESDFDCLTDMGGPEKGRVCVFASRSTSYLEEVYLVTALVPSETACLASLEASPAMRSKMSETNEFMIIIAFDEIPVSGWTCFSTFLTIAFLEPLVAAISFSYFSISDPH